jgi:hypothetical protein
MSVLDPATPWPYLLYTLAGAGFVAFALPRAMNGMPPVAQDIYRLNPYARPLAALVYWVLWPLLASILALAGIVSLALRIMDLFDDKDGE